MNYHFIAIEGNIGAGKTTLAQKLSTHYHSRLILEQFADNPFLPLFYKDKERYAFPLELSFLSDRYEQLRESLADTGAGHDLVIADYTIIKSQLFARHNLPDNEYELFLKMAAIMKTTLPQPDLLIYLHAPIDRLQQQIRKRGRPYEQNIEDAYLAGIEQSYQQYLNQENMNMLIINTDIIDLTRKDHFQLLIRILESGKVSGKQEMTL